MIDLEKVLTRIFKHKLIYESRGKNWKRNNQFIADLKDVYDQSDLTAGELCDALEISMDVLSELLAKEKAPREPDVWEQNLVHGLPLFVPVRLKGLV